MDPLQIGLAAALLAVYFMFEFWPVTLMIVILIPVIVLVRRYSKSR
jgi:hypothetical protein